MTTFEDNMSPARHVAELIRALPSLDVDRLSRWGVALARTLAAGGRLLVAGNGGSAAQAQHLTAELVGRFRRDRRPLSALALHSDMSTVTALSNDFGYDDVFARQVLAHGRPGDVLLALSTSGTSTNLIRAVHAAATVGVTTWAMTGPLPNLLAAECDEYLACAATSPPTVQECHLVGVHLLCMALDTALDAAPHTAQPADTAPPQAPTVAVDPAVGARAVPADTVAAGAAR